jgi:hypothetical protein
MQKDFSSISPVTTQLSWDKGEFNSSIETHRDRSQEFLSTRKLSTEGCPWAGASLLARAAPVAARSSRRGHGAQEKRGEGVSGKMQILQEKPSRSNAPSAESVCSGTMRPVCTFL